MEYTGGISIKTRFLNKNVAGLKLTKDNSFLIFPFDIIAGYITSTENGIRENNNINVKDYSTFQRVFTGLENILAVWENSWKIEKKKDTDTFLTKTPQVGRSFQAYINKETMGATFEPSTISSDFLAEYTEETFTIHTYEDIQEKDLFKLYIIPTLKEVKWLYIKRADKYFLPNGKLHHVEIEMTTLNNKVAKSGGAIEEFIQRSAPGEGYTYPIVEKNQNVIIDEVRLRDIPITSLQEEYSGPAGFNTMFCYGRPTIQKTENGVTRQTFNPKIEAPRLLLPLRLETPKASPLNTRPSSEGNWYSGMFQPTMWEQYKNWKEQFKSSFDMLQRNAYEGVLTAIDLAVIKASNPYNAKTGSYHKILWDTTWKPQIIKTFNTKPNNMTNDKIELDGNYSITEMLAHNIFATSFIDALPLQKEQNIVWTLKDIPVIGGFLSKLTFGVPIGWNDNAIKLKADDIWLTLPTSIVEFGNVLKNGNTGNKAFIPFETLTGERKDEAAEFSGINATGSIFKVELTDRFKKTISYQEVHSGIIMDVVDDFVFNTLDLGQSLPLKDDNGKLLPIIGNNPLLKTLPKTLLWDETCKPVPRSVDTPGYVIDTATTKSVAKLVYRRTFFSNDIEVWTGTYQSRSLFTGSIRDWENTIKMSHWEESNNKIINYPDIIVDPKPPTTNNPVIEIKEATGTYEAQVFINEAKVQPKFPQYGSHVDTYLSTPKSIDTTRYGGVTNIKNEYEKIVITYSETRGISGDFDKNNYAGIGNYETSNRIYSKETEQPTKSIEINIDKLVSASTILAEISTSNLLASYVNEKAGRGGFAGNFDARGTAHNLIKISINGNLIKIELASKLDYSTDETQKTNITSKYFDMGQNIIKLNIKSIKLIPKKII